MSGTLTAVLPGTLATIARALQGRLQLVFPLTLFQHGFVPAKVTAKEWGKLTTRTPFVGLGWNDVAPASNAGRLFAGESVWTVFLTARNAGSIGARYFGDAQGPGLFTMAQVAAAVLHGFTIEGVGSVMVRRVANAFGEEWDDGQAIALVDVAVSTVLDIPDAIGAPDDLGLFKTLAATWNFATEGVGQDEMTDVIAVPTNLGDL